MIVLIISVLLFLWYATLEGEREAWYYQVKGRAGSDASKNIPNEHATFTIQRSLVVISLMAIIYICNQGGLVVALVYGVSLALMFPFFHDGAYYYTRHKLDPTVYEDGWLDNSTTSTAKLNINPAIRISMFLFGVSALLGLELYLHLIK